jgi:hypothetical protein
MQAFLQKAADLEALRQDFLLAANDLAGGGAGNAQDENLRERYLRVATMLNAAWIVLTVDPESPDVNESRWELKRSAQFGVEPFGLGVGERGVNDFQPASSVSHEVETAIGAGGNAVGGVNESYLTGFGFPPAPSKFGPIMGAMGGAGASEQGTGENACKTGWGDHGRLDPFYTLEYWEQWLREEQPDLSDEEARQKAEELLEGWVEFVGSDIKFKRKMQEKFPQVDWELPGEEEYLNYVSSKCGSKE